MKKQVFTLALSILGLSAFCQSAIWQPYNSNIDTSTYVRYLSAVDTNTVWGIGFPGGGNPAPNHFTRTIDGANFHSGIFLPDTNTYAPSSISAVDANTAFIPVYVKTASASMNGQILKTTNGGATWVNIAATGTTSTTGMFLGIDNFPDWVHFWDVNNGIALGDPNGNTTAGSDTNRFEIWRTHNGGTSWTRVLDANVPLPTQPYTSEYGLTNSYTTWKGYVWYGTTDGRVFASPDSGKTWTVSSTILAESEGLAFRDSLNGLVWGSTSTTSYVYALLKTSDGGHTWTRVTIGNNVGTAAISAIPKTKGYMSVGLDSASSLGAGVVGNGIITSVTYNDGASWTILESHAGGAVGTNTVLPFYMQSVQMLDSLNGWAGNTSNNTLPYGTDGMNKFRLGHNPGCPITITTSSSSTPFNVCSASSATITASGLNTYTWSTSATTASITVTPSVTTSYSVAGTTTAGCANYETFSISVVNPIVSAASKLICAGTTATLTAGGATTYTWSPAAEISGSNVGASVVASPTVSTTYTVMGTEQGCIATTTANVNLKPAPSVTATPSSYTVCIYGTATITATGATTYSWTGGIGGNLSATSGSTVTASPSSSVAPTSYTIAGTGTNTCVGYSVVTLTVNTTCYSGIEQYAGGSDEVSVYPNPSNGFITVSIANIGASTSLYVTDIIGQEVMKTDVKDVNTNIDLSALQKGVYMLNIINGQSKHIEKLIIQ